MSEKDHEQLEETDHHHRMVLALLKRRANGWQAENLTHKESCAHQHALAIEHSTPFEDVYALCNV
jgi:hypothetical protein